MIQLGNGNWAVKEDNLLGFRYDETEGVYFPREMTFGRACDATRVNPDGLIERVPYNLLQQSNTFSTTWTNLNTTETGGQADKDGGTNAWKLTKTAANAYIQQQVTFAGTNTFSVYMKADASNWVALMRGDGQKAFFDLSGSGALGSVTSGIGSNIESVGNGWFRCSFTFVNNSTNYARIYPAEGNNDTSGTSGSIYIQDAQLVEGTTAKPYFPTTNRQDIARIDYSSGTGALLLEPQRTNSVLYSEQFDNGAWGTATSEGTTAPAITANYAVSPDGTQNADRIVLTKPSADGEWALLRQTRTITLTAHTQSIWVKATDSSQVGKYIDIYLYAGSYGEVYNFQLTNDWQRITGVRTTPTSTSCEFAFGKARTTPGGSTLANMATDVLIWGAQLEASSYPTSYIPTAGSTVTRLADTCYKTGVADWIGQTEGTLFAEVEAQLITTSNQDITLSDGTANNRIVMRLNTSGLINAIGVFGGSVEFNMGTTPYTTGATYKIAVAYKANDVVLYVNGTQAATDTSVSISGTFSRFGFDANTSGTQNLYSKLNHATIYKTRLSNSELAALTTI